MEGVRYEPFAAHARDRFKVANVLNKFYKLTMLSSQSINQDFIWQNMHERFMLSFSMQFKLVYKACY